MAQVVEAAAGRRRRPARPWMADPVAARMLRWTALLYAVAWAVHSDAFPGSHGTSVTAFSWFAASLEIAAALLFAIAGAVAWRRSRDQP